MDQQNSPRDQLQEGLNEIRSSDGPYHYEVFNFGLPGLNLEGMVRVNQQYALGYSPDVILYSHICDDLSAIDVSSWYRWVRIWEPRLQFLPKEVRSFFLGPVLSGYKELLYKIDDFWEYRTSGYIKPNAASLRRYRARMRELLGQVWQLSEKVPHKILLLDYCGYPPFKEVVRRFNQEHGGAIDTVDLTDIELDHTEHPTLAAIGETVDRLTPLLEDYSRAIIKERKAQLLNTKGGCVHDGYAAPECLRCSSDRTGQACSQYRFEDFSCGGHHCCARTTEGRIRCWGAGSEPEQGFPHYGQTLAPSGQFKDLSVGLYHSCGVQTDGRVLCWGRDQYGETRAPVGVFQSVSLGDNHSCGLRGDDTLHCWGESKHGKLDAPEGRFVEISSGGDHSCARNEVGSLQCWGRITSDMQIANESGWALISSGRRGLCGLDAKGSIRCLGPVLGVVPTDSMQQLDAGGFLSCGVTTEEQLRCWGPGVERYDNPPAGLYRKVDVGLHHACALTTGGELRCWGHSGLAYKELVVPLPSGS